MAHQKWSKPTGPTLSLQQRWVQQLHHVLDLCVQLRHVTLSHNISQHRQEVVGTIHPAWKEADGAERMVGVLVTQIRQREQT